MNSIKSLANIHHIHLYVQDLAAYKEVFEQLFHAQLVERIFVGPKEILKFDLNGSSIFLSPTRTDQDEINHIGIASNNVREHVRKLQDFGWEILEERKTDSESTVFLKSAGGIVFELMQVFD
ncbi:VOC family protein [Alicyclobacillus tolerans]|uniref:VOC family protein n=1 Tax=Alicyclobacillus tolerans TaxID=90970 RepID=UPI001F43723C|nr:VOC family protein [Alicyclobacillus tolerans]MCF8565149.1 VOC family protein [Alicyclobacillus tolerans]